MIWVYKSVEFFFKIEFFWIFIKDIFLEEKLISKMCNIYILKYLILSDGYFLFVYYISFRLIVCKYWLK